MKDPSAKSRLWHVALQDDGDRGIEEGERALEEGLSAPRLKDQQRLAVVLQGAALLAHLEHAGWRLGDGTLEHAWRSAHLVGEELRLSDVRPGPFVDPPHRLALGLLRRVFGATNGEISSRGAARKAARSLLARWRQQLYPIAADVVVAQILDSAPFLWQPSSGAARRALAAEHRRGEQRHLWVVGPGRARRRLLRATSSLDDLLELLASRRARDVWDGFTPDLDPWKLYRDGRFRRAAAVWRRRRALRGSEALAFARALLAAGRGHEALEKIKRRKDTDALLLRFFVQMALGERTAAKKALHALDGAELSDRQLVRLGEMAIRLYASRGGRPEDVRAWVARLLEVEDPKARLGALIVAASASWDLDDPAAMLDYLEEARPALEDPSLAWRWHHAEALRLYDAGAGPDAREQIEKAFLLARRRLGQTEAARMWNDVGVMRLLAGDVAGAEKACRHGVRLTISCDGNTVDTLGLHNLASLKIRRGRLDGVEEQLERSLAENRRSNNARAVVCDRELQMRFELARGRPEAALQRRAEVGDADPSIARQEVFAALEGRARGWLGQSERAAACLEEAGDAGLFELDLEERACAWALAGDLEKACRQVEDTPWAPLFRSLAADTPPADGEWTPLDALEPYRAARFLHDIERLRPGTVPASRARRGAEVLRRVGAPAMAEVLERGVEPWLALRRYAESPPGTERLRQLFDEAGYPGVRLYVNGDGGPRTLVDGEGGPARLEEPRAGRTLVLEAPFIDEVQKSFFQLIARDLFAEASDGSAIESETQQRSSHLGDGILGESRSLLRAVERLDRLADGEMTILILGESGTGKELVARRAHRLSRRAEGPFMAVNCAAFSESLIQSELFGHARGAFTGADRDRQGIFEAARSGTVFLDEIGDLPLKVQGILLRVLQEGEIRRVGDSLARKVDARVVAATHQGLAAMVQEGTFRRDLYYRLNAGTIELPPLRERGRDVILIARSALQKSRVSKKARGLSKAAERALLQHRWPGNVRELVNMIEVAAAMADGGVVERHHLDLPDESNKPLKCDFKYEVEQFQKRLIVEALEESGGNQSQAASRVGLTRQAFSYHVRKFRL